jgi:hypothetical protein
MGILTAKCGRHDARLVRYGKVERPRHRALGKDNPVREGARGSGASRDEAPGPASAYQWLASGSRISITIRVIEAQNCPRSHLSAAARRPSW